MISLKSKTLNKTWQLSLVILGLFPLLLQAETFKGIKFYSGSWDEVQQLSKQYGKPIFVEAYVDWYLPCQTLADDVFTQQEVADYYNAAFVNYRVNIETPEGKRFAKQYNVQSLPDLIFSDSNGQILHRSNGLKNKEELMHMAQEVFNQVDTMPDVVPIFFHPEDELKTMSSNSSNAIVLNMESMQRQYRHGYRKKAFLYDYAYMLREHDIDYRKVVNEYVDGLNLADLSKEKNINFILDFSGDIATKAINLLIKHKSFFENKLGIHAVNDRLKAAIFNAVHKAATNRNERLFAQAKNMAKAAHFPDEKRFVFEIKSAYYQGTHNWKQFAKITREFVDTYDTNDAAWLNRKALDLIQAVESTKHLLLAKKWIEKSIYLDPQFYNYDAYAYVLFKLGMEAEAGQAKQKLKEFNGQQPLQEKGKMFWKSTYPNHQSAPKPRT